MKHLSGSPFYGRLLASPTNIRLGWKRNVADKHSSLLQKFVNYGQKKLYSHWSRTYFIKLFTSVIIMVAIRPGLSV